MQPVSGLVGRTERERSRETEGDTPSQRQRSERPAALPRDRRPREEAEAGQGGPGRAPPAPPRPPGTLLASTSGPQMGLSRGWEGESGRRPRPGLEFINSCAGGAAGGEFQRGPRGSRPPTPAQPAQPLHPLASPPPTVSVPCPPGLRGPGLGQRRPPCGAEGTGGWAAGQGEGEEGYGVPGRCPAGASPWERGRGQLQNRSEGGLAASLRGEARGWAEGSWGAASWGWAWERGRGAGWGLKAVGRRE